MLASPKTHIHGLAISSERDHDTCSLGLSGAVYATKANRVSSAFLGFHSGQTSFNSG
jgi:hypothetical protein